GVADVVVTSWYGLLAPAGTPPEVAEQLARDAREILNQPAVRESLNQQGLSESTMTPAAFGAYIRNETNTWAGVIKARRIVAQ
ncbi:MAG: tripartite tricarboxylate transporter substrate binding protein, partial [Rhodoferax sp.]|nr:tripartite tricarboxylate transporter substrate binding protein [Rhodoferax sp.]